MVEKIKRPKYIVTGFVFSAITLIVFFTITIFVLYPKIEAIGLEKDDVKTKIENLETLKKKGITYAEFNTLKNTYKANLYLASLLKKSDEKFFTANFVNTKAWEDFDSFFAKKVNEVNRSQNSQTYKEIQESYKNILPTYVEDNYKNEEWVMTDLKFVTYIESILYTFNLEIANKNLSIGNLNVLPEYSWDKDTPLDTTIFYIPYTFDITGRKTDIIDFIYFLENVWSISVSDEGNVVVNEDNFIKKSLIWFDEWNILENQIIDIERIKMADYIDSWIEENNNEKLVDFIKQTQWNEKIDISIDVRFYVKGVPNYKILEGINGLSERYNSLKGEYEKAKKSNKLTWDEKINIEKWIIYLNELNNTINEIKKDKSDLNKTYKRVLEVNKLLDMLQKTIEK